MGIRCSEESGFAGWVAYGGEGEGEAGWRELRAVSLGLGGIGLERWR